jgi:alcohol dehydrogenase
MYGFVAVDRAPGLWGGYATHQYLGPDSLVLPVPPSLDPVMATLFNPVGAGIRWGVTVPGTGPGAVVAILGPGIRGLSALAAVQDAGASFTLVTGAGPRDAERLRMAEAFGASLTVDVTETDPVRALRAATGGALADVVIDVTARAPAAFGQAIGLARAGGTVVVAGTRGVAETPGFSPDTVVYKELRILGALGVDTTAYEAALALVASQRYPFEALPREVVGLDGVAPLLARLAGEADGPRPVHAVVVP